MAHEKTANRSYNEKEIGGLIQRATELHEEAIGASEHSLSLKEIEHIASELGLPPEHLQAAALELEDRRYSDKSFRFWGGPFFVDETRVVGETMTEEQWEQIVLELRRFTGKNGQISELGRAREWAHYTGEGANGINFQKMQVTIRPGDSQTSIHIRKNYNGIAILYAVPLFISLFFAAVLLTEQPDLVKFALTGGGGVAAVAAVRAFISQRARRHAERLVRLADLLRDKLSASPSSAMTNGSVSESVELSELDERTSVRIELPEQDERAEEIDNPEQVNPVTNRKSRV